MTDKCTDCNRDILDGEGIANTPKGIKCNECGGKYYNKGTIKSKGLL